MKKPDKGGIGTLVSIRQSRSTPVELAGDGNHVRVEVRRVGYAVISPATAAER